MIAKDSQENKNHMLKKSRVISGVGLVILLLFSTSALSLGKKTHTVPYPDAMHIKHLFKRMIDCHDFSYTIFGSKPMSLAGYELKMPHHLPVHRWVRARYLYARGKEGLRVWHKWSHSFDIKDFIFLDDEKDIFPGRVLAIINKKNMLEILHKNREMFSKELGSTFDPSDFLFHLERREISLGKAIHHNQKLLGIMLGYGVRNATLFQERYELMKAIWERKKKGLPEDNSLAQKLEEIEVECGDFSELDRDAIIHPLYFLADVSHPETKALQKKYEEERQYIIELRKQRNFMNRVIKRLTSSDVGFYSRLNLNELEASDRFLGEGKC